MPIWITTKQAANLKYIGSFETFKTLLPILRYQHENINAKSNDMNTQKFH